MGAWEWRWGLAWEWELGNGSLGMGAWEWGLGNESYTNDTEDARAQVLEGH